jgi:hypothetical protein
MNQLEEFQIEKNYEYFQALIIKLFGNFQYFVDGDGEDAHNIKDKRIFQVIISDLNRIFSQQSFLVKTCIEVDEDAAHEDEDGRDVEDLKETLVVLKGPVVF